MISSIKDLRYSEVHMQPGTVISEKLVTGKPIAYGKAAVLFKIANVTDYHKSLLASESLYSNIL